MLLFLAISSRYFVHSTKDSLGAFLLTFLKAIPVSVVVTFFPSITLSSKNNYGFAKKDFKNLNSLTFACLNHLSDWLSLMVFPSAAWKKEKYIALKVAWAE